MKYPKYAYIPQCVFPNQRDDERIFVLTRRHYVDFLSTIIGTAFLFIFPIALFIFAYYNNSLEVFSVLEWDLLILGAIAYYLLISSYFLTAWFRYYYDMFIVTDSRIIDVSQKGLFYREIYELNYEQIEDISTRTGGFLSTIFEAGDLQIQTAGSQRNFNIRRIPKPNIISEVIRSIGADITEGISEKKRMPKTTTIGLVEREPVVQGSEIPRILNFSNDLICSRKQYLSGKKKSKNFREGFDRWWWAQMKRGEENFIDYEYFKKENGEKSGDTKE